MRSAEPRWGTNLLGDIVLPTDYRINADEALAQYPVEAANYLRHTLVGDDRLDDLMDELSSMPQDEMARYIRAGMDLDLETLRFAPQGLRDYFVDYPPPDPPWLNYEEFIPGIRAFHQESGLILVGFAAGVLVDGFTTYIAKSFVITGRIFDAGVRRLQQNNRHFLDVLYPGGLLRDGDGWKLSVRIRFIHAQIRRLLRETPEWDAEAWGLPISAAHLGYAVACFSARTIKHAESVGVHLTHEERDSLMAIWRYVGYIMGIPESILFTSEADALRLHRVASLCEPPMSEESIIMANALINSAPLVAGVTEPEQRRRMVAREVYPISRALIGDELADELRFPRSRTRGILFQFRLLHSLRKLRARILRHALEADNFGALIALSAFDEAGLSYHLPDHAFSEYSGHW